ncbi:MAG: RES domain-containing protein [Bryobacteraceae bacterium]|jgi:RES domain-containing protein
MVIFRLGSGRYPANDGLGASLYGGRWNRKGTPVIYAAASRALCALEVLTNANELAGDYVVTPIEVPDDLGTTTLTIETLPSNWDAGQSTQATANIGTDWANSLATAVLVVPSVVVPREHNYISNPRHPDFPGIRFLSPEPFYFDDRLRHAWLNE